MSNKRRRAETEIIQCEQEHKSTTDHRRPSPFMSCADLILPYLTPQELATVSLGSKTLSQLSRSVSLLRSLDASRTLEKLPIPFHHHHNNRKPPPPLYSYFLYTPSQLLPSQPFSRQPWGIPGPTVPGGTGPGLVGRDDCLGEEEMRTGILRECGEGCDCGSECRNKLSRGGISVRLKVLWCEEKGWGLFADESIRGGQFVCEYAGEVLTTEEARRRQEMYDKLTSSGAPNTRLKALCIGP